ncbi:MAG TPA: NTP transferase domain-containing protein [Candidatus Acidoferrales bacterium]|nr:NTP transferase domain-containing protein [Candidatus Acidoferrales bacterium]
MKSHARNGSRAPSTARREEIFPIILAAGKWAEPFNGASLPCNKAREWIRRAVSNCAGVAKPIVVIGWYAEVLGSCVPKNATLVINENWEQGQISSLRAGLRRVPDGAAFMVYPVDLHRMRKELIDELVAKYWSRPRGSEIVMPMYHEHAGHPAILSAALREELETAETARHVVYRDPRRLKFLKTDSAAVIHLPRERATQPARAV